MGRGLKSAYWTTTIGAAIALVLSACNEDGASAVGGNASTGGTPTPAPTPGPKHIFVTAAKHNGRFGINANAALNAADLFCHLDVNHTDNGTYKALLASSVRDPNSNWVLAASTEYRRLIDDAIIGTTNASGTFDFPLTNAFDPPGNYSYAWTGLYDDWSNGAPGYACNNWTNKYSYGFYSYGSVLNKQAIHYGGTYNYSYCNTMREVICVEQ